MTDDAVTFDDYLKALVYRAFDVRDGNPGEYRKAIESIAYARERWTLIALAEHELAAQRIQAEREADYQRWLLDLADWLDEIEPVGYEANR